MSVIKLEAIEALKAALVCGVPDLAGKVCVGFAAPGHKLGFPSMVVDPISFRFMPYQASEIDGHAFDSVVMSVGLHEVTVQLRITAATQLQRYQLEDQISNIFLSQPLTPGVLATPVSGCSLLAGHFAHWIIDDEEWEDSRAFDQVYESTVTVLGEIPALVTRADTYTVEQLRLGLTHNMDTSIPLDPSEFVTINQDGTVTP